MALKLTNNASSTLAGSISALSTTILVQTGDGVDFPTLGADDYFPATLTKIVGGLPVREIVKVTATGIDSFTVVRGQEGTTAVTFSAGDAIELRMTAGTFETLIADGGTDKISTDAAATGAVVLDCADTFVHDLTLAGNTTVSLDNLPALSTTQTTIVIRVKNGASAYSLTWSIGTIVWLTPTGAPPSAPAIDKTIEYVFTTKDNANFLGRKGASN
jgi:hypothetical protein